MWIFLIENKKREKTTFFLLPPINETFLEKHEKWPLASNRSTFFGQKKREVRYIYMVFFQKWPFFDLLVNKGRKRSKMDPKNGSKNVWYFLPVPRFFEIPVPGIFFKTRFLPVSIRYKKALRIENFLDPKNSYFDIF